MLCGRVEWGLVVGWSGACGMVWWSGVRLG